MSTWAPFPPARSEASTVAALALAELGLTPADLDRMLRLLGHDFPPLPDGSFDFDQANADAWFDACCLLYLPLDSYAEGYSRLTHRHWIGRAILMGCYLLPRTPRLESFFGEFVRVQKQGSAFERAHLGGSLWKRTQALYRQAAIQRRELRRKMASLLSGTRECLESCCTSLSEDRPAEGPSPISGALPGLRLGWQVQSLLKKTTSAGMPPIPRESVDALILSAGGRR